MEKSKNLSPFAYDILKGGFAHTIERKFYFYMTILFYIVWKRMREREWSQVRIDNRKTGIVGIIAFK